MNRTIQEQFESLSKPTQKRILSELEEIFTLQCNPSIEEKVQSLEYIVKEKDSEISRLNKQIEQLRHEINVLKREKNSKIKLQVIYSNLPKHERERIKERIVGAYLYKHLATRYNELQDLYKKLQIAHDDLICRFIKSR
jgi:ribosomal protein RSM22 (predicted rRNA methylase)